MFTCSMVATSYWHRLATAEATQKLELSKNTLVTAVDPKTHVGGIQHKLLQSMLSSNLQLLQFQLTAPTLWPSHELEGHNNSWVRERDFAHNQRGLFRDLHSLQNYPLVRECLVM